MGARVQVLDHQQQRRIALGDLRQIAIDSGGHSFHSLEEQNITCQQDLAVGRQSNLNISLQCGFRRMQSELGSTRDHHRIQKGRKKSTRNRAGLQRFILVRHLLSHFGQPVSGILRAATAELGSELGFQQLLGVINVRQTAEELHTAGKS